MLGPAGVLILRSAAAPWFLCRPRISTALLGSTLSTGWHYSVDVLAGFALALICMAAAHALASKPSPCTAQPLMEPEAVMTADCESSDVPEIVSQT